ncbi:MAG: NAD(P)/FAD-dependent oxidoreductase [Acidimicrobiales bacterium]
MVDVVVVGAGLAGLACAQDLTRSGLECTVVEAADGVGGRVRTDLVDGYRLDRGFQILLTAYPQVRSRLDLDALELAPFDPGAHVWTGDRFHRIADPLRRPTLALQTFGAPIGGLADKLRLARLVADVGIRSVPDLLRRPDMSTDERLRAAGFSDTMIERFWRPLFSGIQLDPDLEVSRRRFDTILRMLAVGGTGVPRSGMGAIPDQLAASLPTGTIRLDSPVRELVSTGTHIAVTLETGERIDARAVVVATDGPTAHRLLGSRIPDPGSRAAAACWFATASAPRSGPVLMLDGVASGPARNVMVMTEAAPTYAPPGRSLIVAAVPGDEALDPDLTDRVRVQLARWFGSLTTDWDHLRTDVIPHGQPLQTPPFAPKQRVALGDGVFVCGDHRDTASIQGAMFSGERTAAAVSHHLAALRHSR